MAVTHLDLLEPDDTWGLTARYLFFFLLGFHARTLVKRLAAATSPLRATVAVDVRGVPGVAFALNVAAVVCGVLVAAQLARWRIGLPLVLLGRHTLPVYLGNMPWLGLIALALLGVRIPTALQYLLPVLLAVLTTGLTLLTWRVLLTLRAGWLYDLPGPGRSGCAPARRPECGRYGGGQEVCEAFFDRVVTSRFFRSRDNDSRLSTW